MWILISLSFSLSSFSFSLPCYSLNLNSVGVTGGRFVLLNDNELRHEVKLLNTECSLRMLLWMIPFSPLNILLSLHLGSSFDSINHLMLFSLLSVIGLSVSALVQILSHQYTQKHKPASVSGVHDVPQGSVLCLLLIYYLNSDPGSFYSALHSLLF